MDRTYRPDLILIFSFSFLNHECSIFTKPGTLQFLFKFNPITTTAQVICQVHAGNDNNESCLGAHIGKETNGFLQIISAWSYVSVYAIVCIAPFYNYLRNFNYCAYIIFSRCII